MVLLKLAALAACLYTYYYVASYIKSRKRQSLAMANGCKEPLDVNGARLDSIRRLRRFFNSRKSGEDIVDDIIAEDFAEASTFQRTVFDGTRTYGTIEPANLQAMLATQFNDYETGIRRYNQLSPVLGRSIFSSDGAFWEHSRALFRPQFSRDNINDLEATDNAIGELVQALGATDSDGWTGNVEMMPLLLNFTLDSDFLFGESVGSQAAAIQSVDDKAKLPVQTPGMQAGSAQFRDDLVVIGEVILNRIRLQTLYFLGDSFKFRAAIKNMRRFVEYFVQKAIEAPASEEKRSGKKTNLLARLATQTQDRIELRDQSFALLFAGRDTTAALLGWCFLRLSLHPEVYAKLRNIILREFQPGEPITFTQLKSCRYLQHFLNEILRVHSTVPFNNRVAARDTTLPVGGGPDQKSPVAVAKGDIIFYSVYFMHRRKDLWGEDAAEFRPERWEETKVPAWQFLPFNGGPRICLGQQFAITEASFVLVRLLQQFDRIVPVDEVEMRRMRKGLGLTMWPLDGVKVRLHKA